MLNINGIGGLAVVVVLMLIVLILFFTVGSKHEADYKAKKRMSAMKQAADKNLNTVDELDSYIKKELREEPSENSVAEKNTKAEKKLERSMKKEAKKAEKAKKAKKQKETENNKSAEKVNASPTISGKSVDMESEKPSNKAEKQIIVPPGNLYNKEIDDLAMNIDTNDIRQLINQNGESSSVEPQTDFADLNDDDKAEKIADMVFDALEKSNTVVPKTNNGGIKAAAVVEKPVVPEAEPADKADVIKKIVKQPAPNVTYVPKVQPEDDDEETPAGVRINLNQIKDLIKNVAAGPETDDFTLDRETTSGDIESATPYVHSIPRILNTKEAIAVSENAPKVTTFYPDGKVVRDNKLMSENSFYDKKEENKKSSNDSDKAETDKREKAEIKENGETNISEKAAVETEVQKENTDNELVKTAVSANDIDEKADKDVDDDIADGKNEPRNLKTGKKSDTADNTVEGKTATEGTKTTETGLDLPIDNEKNEEKSDEKLDEENRETAQTETNGVKNEQTDTEIALPDFETAENAVKKVTESTVNGDTLVLPAEQLKTAIEAVAAETDIALHLNKEETTETDTSTEKNIEDDILMPEKPKAFGYKVAWLAIPNMGSADVLKALDLKNIAPANWTSGLNTAYKEQNKLFVTPCIKGWTLVIGRALWNKIDLNQPIEKMNWLQNLADSFLEVFYFSSMSELNNNGWFYIKEGRLVRAYGYSGELDEVMWNFGPMSREEHSLIQGFSMGKTKVIPSEKDVLALAAAWSVDPTFTNNNSGPDIGFVGRF